MDGRFFPRLPPRILRFGVETKPDLRIQGVLPLEGSFEFSPIYVKKTDFLKACDIRQVSKATVERRLAAIFGQAKEPLQGQIACGAVGLGAD